MKLQLAKLIKEIQFNSPLRKNFFPRYNYNFTPAQLCFLCQCVDKTKDITGAIVEVGCSLGNTTIFLNKYMDAEGIEKEYYAIDTFKGFVEEDVEFEVNNRGKKKELFSAFQLNSKKWFDGTMELNNVTRVQSIETDINKYDLRKINPISFCLLDVDLYRPMKKGLKELYEALNSGGIIVVDDCDASNIRWDGSDRAYKEFMEERQKPIDIVYGKLGVIRKD